MPTASNRIIITVVALLSWIGLSVGPVCADWINLTGAQSAPNIAEIYVEKAQVRVVLEIYVKDLSNFIDILPDQFYKQAGAKPPPMTERMKRFSEQGLQVIADGNKRLQAQLKIAQPRYRKERPNPFAGTRNPITGRPVPGPPEDKRVIYAELTYPLKTLPRELTFLPPVDDRGLPTVSMGFIVYHEGVSVVDYRYLSEPSRLELDWDDPWYSRFENKALKRWQLSGMRIFLYVEPFEVRHEVLVRVKDLAAWMDLGLRGKDYIEVDEFSLLKQRVGDFLLGHSNVRIDGKRLEPILDRTSFVKYTMTRTFFIEQPERLALNTAMIGVIVTYLTRQIPQQVTVNWQLFSDRIQRVPVTAIDPAGPFPSYISPEDNILTWTNFLKNYQVPTVAPLAVDKALTHLKIPVVSLLCLLSLFVVLVQIIGRTRKGKSVTTVMLVGMGLIVAAILLHSHAKVSIARPGVMTPMVSDQEALVILEELLENVYRSFDFRGEEAVYDRLATSVSGGLLNEIYLQNRQSMAVTQAGGAQARVKEVEIQDVTVEQGKDHPLALLFRAGWTAMGTVGHWGHIHMRKNQYRADITVAPLQGAWKIIRLDLLEEKRIDP